MEWIFSNDVASMSWSPRCIVWDWEETDEGCYHERGHARGDCYPRCVSVCAAAVCPPTSLMSVSGIPLEPAYCPRCFPSCSLNCLSNKWFFLKKNIFKKIHSHLKYFINMEYTWKWKCLEDFSKYMNIPGFILSHFFIRIYWLSTLWQILC